MVDGLPGREVVRKQAPGAATSRDVENGLEDLAQGVQSLGRSGALGQADGALRRTIWHRRSRFGMLFSCSEIYRATLSEITFSNSLRREILRTSHLSHSPKFRMAPAFLLSVGLDYGPV
jgi:hypothetical protein